LGDINPPLEDYEKEMLRLFFRLFPTMKRAHSRGQPEVEHLMLEAPSVSFAQDHTAVLRFGTLVKFYRQFCITLRPYLKMRSARTPSAVGRREEAKKALIGTLTNIIGRDRALYWLTKIDRPLVGKASIPDEGCASGHRWLFCQLMTEVIRNADGSTVVPLTIKTRLIKHLAECHRLVREYPSGCIAYPPSPRDPKSINLLRLS